MKQRAISESHQLLLIQIGEKLKKLRKEKCITYVKAAEEIGMDRNTLNSMENGKFYFKFNTLLLALEYYGITVFDFFTEISKSASEQNISSDE
jgi:transcriptional regulator with XRE-family HTH domain